MPEDTPVTNPNELTVAVGEPLTHVPPLLPFVLNKIDEFTQTFVDPLMVPALPEGFTVKVKWAADPNGLQLLGPTV